MQGIFSLVLTQGRGGAEARFKRFSRSTLRERRTRFGIR
jgi:hypothetical protein